MNEIEKHLYNLIDQMGNLFNELSKNCTDLAACNNALAYLLLIRGQIPLILKGIPQ